MTTSPVSTRRTGTAPPRSQNGRLPLFQNFDEHGNPIERPRTLLMKQRTVGVWRGAGCETSVSMAADGSDRFHREIIERTGDLRAADNITDQDLLREVMNTVGKEGRLGEVHPLSSRCQCSPKAGTPTP
ncbi:MAG: hypothetical protein R3F22_04690 [Lysobacteraceae bacterium]